MPRVNLNDPAVWASLFSIGAEGARGRPSNRKEVRLGLHRAIFLPVEAQRAAAVYQALGWTAATRVVVVGCAFGWLLEALQALGMTNVVGVDTSTYIHDRKNLDEDAEIAAAISAVGLSPTAGDGLTLFTTLRGDGGPRAKAANKILNESLATNQSRTNVRDALGGAPFSFEVLSAGVPGMEFLLNLSDVEAVQASNLAHQLTSGRVSHLVTTAAALPVTTLWNRKTLEQWKALLPTDTFIENVTWRVL